MLHGPFGEDGTVQGLLELAGVPYVGAGVLASALCMDKDVFKSVMRDHGIPVTRNITLRLGDEARNPFGYPCFVKPARLGSSIGITKAHDLDELRQGVALAFEHDEKVLVEELVGGIEVEVGVLGNLTPDRVAARRDRRHAQRVVRLRGEVRRGRDGAARSGARSRTRRASACRSWRCGRSSRPTARAWPAPTASSPSDGEVLVNELNTIPGFTPTSVYAQLFAASGIAYGELLERLADLARRALRPPRPAALLAGADLVHVHDLVGAEVGDPEQVVRVRAAADRERGLRGDDLRPRHDVGEGCSRHCPP